MKKRYFQFLCLSLIAILLSFSTTSCSKDDEEMIEIDGQEPESSNSQTDDGYEYIGTISAVRIYHLYYGHNYKKSDTLYKFQYGNTYYYAYSKKSTDKKTALRNIKKSDYGYDVSGYKYYCDFGTLGNFYFN